MNTKTTLASIAAGTPWSTMAGVFETEDNCASLAYKADTDSTIQMAFAPQGISRETRDSQYLSKADIKELRKFLKLLMKAMP